MEADLIRTVRGLSEIKNDWEWMAESSDEG
jgi:hypothetical protein